MSARLADGWLVVDCDATSLATVDLAATAGTPGEHDWQPAFRDAVDGQRVAKIRPAAAPGGAGYAYVWLRVDGQVTRAGRL